MLDFVFFSRERGENRSRTEIVVTLSLHSMVTLVREREGERKRGEIGKVREVKRKGR